MNKDFDNNGFKYVDLDLPSNTLWATRNVGADKPTDYGLYFQWGDTVGYSKDQVGKDKQFTWDDYKWNSDGTSSKFSKYKTEGVALELEDDAVNVHMGGAWHMPSPSQIQELINETKNTWTTQDGVDGRLFTSKNNGNSIFIPAAGGAWDGSVHDFRRGGYVWSSVLSENYVGCGQGLGFCSSGIVLGDGYRNFGFSVRGVLG